jgi:hypothetical protein
MMDVVTVQLTTQRSVNQPAHAFLVPGGQPRHRDTGTTCLYLERIDDLLVDWKVGAPVTVG